MIGSRFGLHSVREFVQRKQLVSMTAEFINLAAGQDGASGSYIVTASERAGNRPIPDVNILLEVNSTQVVKKRTDSSGQLIYNFKLDQSGDYNFVAYLIGEIGIGSLITTPSVAKVLGVRALTVDTVDSSSNTDITSTVKIVSNMVTVQTSHTLAGLNPEPVPSTRQIVNGEYNTPFVLYIPTEMAGGETVTVMAQDVIDNGTLGLVGNQDSLTFNLTSDITQAFYYLPFKTISVTPATGCGYDVSGDPMGRFTKMQTNLYQVMMGYSVTLQGSPADQEHYVAGWVVNGKSTRQPTVSMVVTDNVEADIICGQNNIFTDLSTFETGTDGWSAAKPKGQVSDSASNGVLTVTSIGGGQMFGAWKSYDFPPASEVPSFHISFDFNTIGSNPAATIFVVHGQGVQFDDSGQPMNIHSQYDIGRAGHVDKEMPVTGHTGGPLSVFIAMVDMHDPPQSQLLLQNILVTHLIPPEVPSPPPVSSPPPGTTPPVVGNPGLPQG